MREFSRVENCALGKSRVFSKNADHDRPDMSRLNARRFGEFDPFLVYHPECDVRGPSRAYVRIAILCVTRPLVDACGITPRETGTTASESGGRKDVLLKPPELTGLFGLRKNRCVVLNAKQAKELDSI